MAVLTVKSDKFAPTEVVSAYPASNWSQSQLPPSGAAVGSATSTGTVAADGTVVIAGLAPSTDYYLRGGTSGNYVRARTSALTSADAGGVAASLGAANTVTTPTASAAVATISAPPPGTYKVRVVVSLTGTAETQLVNMTLRSNNAFVATLLTVPGTTVFEIPRLVHAAGNIHTQVTALATTGAIYTVQITATQIE